MKVRKLLPLLVLPTALFIYGTGKNQNTKKSTTSSTFTPQASKVEDISPLRNPELTPSVLKALGEMDKFLEKYTGNGRFNRGTKPRLIEGLKVDYVGIKEAAKSKNEFSRKIADKYPNNIGLFNTLVRSEVERTANKELDESLAKYGVDPNTANCPDNAPVTHKVTRSELHNFRDNRQILDEWWNVAIPNGKVIILKEGISREAIKHIMEKRPGLPPGAEIVDASFIEQNIEAYQTFDENQETTEEESTTGNKEKNNNEDS